MKYYTTQEVADIFGVHYQTINDWRRSGLLNSSFRVGTAFLFTDEDLADRKQPRKAGRPRKSQVA